MVDASPAPVESTPSRPSAPQVERIDPTATPGWDAAIARLPGASFFHSSAWARVLTGAYGYQPAYFAVRSGDTIRGVLPLMEVDSWLTGRRGIGLPFTDESAPLAPDSDTFQLLSTAALAHGQARRWKYLEVRGGRAQFGAVPASNSFLGHKLDLTIGETALFAKCDSSVRRAVRKAEQSDLTLEFSRDLAAVRTFHELLCLTRKRHGVPPQPFSFFAQIHRHVLAPGHGWVVLAKHNGTPVAGAVYFHFGSSVIYKYGASNEAFQQFRGNNLVMWEAIKRYSAEGFASFDFGRTALGNEGLKKFKLSWGSTEQTVEYVRKDLRTDRFVAAAGEEKSSAALFRALPNPVFRLVGSLLYKHVA